MFQKKKWFVTGIVLALSLGLAACASKGTDEDPAKKENGKAVEELAPEFTYVAKFGDAPEELKDINRSAICNGKFYALQYYFDSEKNEDHQSLIQYSILKDGLGEGETILDFGGKNESPINFCVDDAGNVYLLKSVWPEGPGESATEAQLNAYYENARKDVNYYLMKYDEQGNQIYEAEFSEETKGEEYFYPQYMAADEKGRVFMGLDQKIWTFDENGKKSGEINLDSQAYIYGLGNGKDNKCYIVYVSYGDTKMNTVFGELDYDAKQIGKKYQNYPAANMGVNSFIKGTISSIT